MSKTYSDWAKEIINKVGTNGANKLISALDLEISKIKYPEDFVEEIEENNV